MTVLAVYRRSDSGYSVGFSVRLFKMADAGCPFRYHWEYAFIKVMP